MTRFEEWRPVVGYEGLYEVSSLGRVRGINRLVDDGRGRLRYVPEKIRKLGPSTNGYLQVRLGSRIPKVHCLVAAAFLGPRPKGRQVCHNDGDKQNNAASNLRYDTPSANRRDSVRHGTHSETRKTHCPRSHPYDEANTYVSYRGERVCRICKAAYQKRARRRRATAS